MAEELKGQDSHLFMTLSVQLRMRRLSLLSSFSYSSVAIRILLDDDCINITGEI
jgi:hypothetical protein